jgi:hypothetical protein
MTLSCPSQLICLQDPTIQEIVDDMSVVLQGRVGPHHGDTHAKLEKSTQQGTVHSVLRT